MVGSQEESPELSGERPKETESGESADEPSDTDRDSVGTSAAPTESDAETAERQSVDERDFPWDISGAEPNKPELTDQSQSERVAEESGSWRGKGDQYLNYEENYSVGQVFDRIGEQEDSLTDNLQVHETDMDDVKLVGLENRLKSKERFKEKTAELLAADLRESPREAAETIPDAIRYTFQIPAEKYVEGYNGTVERLEQDGYEMVFGRNFWDNPEYKGINTRWRTATGQLFEVQFHTPESVAAKQLTHAAYERIRNPLTDYRQIEQVEAFQEEVSSAIPIPRGATVIPDYRRKGY